MKRFAQMEQLSDGQLSVINGGIPGWGVFQEEILLRRVIDRIKPDYVLVTILQGDVLRQPYESEEELRAYVTSCQRRRFLRRSSRLLTIAVRQLDRLSLIRSGQAVPNQRTQVDEEPQGPSSTFRKCWSEDRKRLVAMHELIQAHGAKLVLAAWPQESRNTDYFSAEMAELGEQLCVTVVDLRETLAKYDKEDLKIPGDSHPTALARAGCRRIHEGDSCRCGNEIDETRNKFGNKILN